jgi:hypothetical protein
MNCCRSRLNKYDGIISLFSVDRDAADFEENGHFLPISACHEGQKTAKSSRAQKTPSSWNMATLLKKQWSLDRVISRSQKN